MQSQYRAMHIVHRAVMIFAVLERRWQKPCCRKDNGAMCPMYGWPEKVQDSLTMHMATVPEVFNGLLFT